MKSAWKYVAAITVANCGLLIVPAYAQQANSNSYTDLSEYLINGNGQVTPQQQLATGAAYNTTSIVKQAGTNNSATATLVGAGDITTQIQNGSANSSTVSVNGTQNSVSTTQIGNSNSVALGVVGNNNAISNTQIGNGLSYQLSVVGAAQSVSVQQYGRK